MLNIIYYAKKKSITDVDINNKYIKDVILMCLLKIILFKILIELIRV